MSNAELWCCFILAIWLLLSVLAQIPSPIADEIRYLDLFGVIPNWSFFAPRPASHDWHLLFRDYLADGHVSPWTETQIPERNPFFCFIWNPHRRQQKALSDAVTILLKNVGIVDPERLQLSVSYLLLLKYISLVPRTQTALATQFLIMKAEGPTDPGPRPVFISNTHSLPT
jgi:hypothetical protein